MSADVNNIFEQPADYSVEEISLEEYLSIIHQTKTDESNSSYMDKLEEKLTGSNNKKVA
jgi:hypothetical protein